jgi:homoserine O-acetyltransferase/O-succinyltransferase
MRISRVSCNDPEWLAGNYANQPRQFKVASVWFTVATNGGSMAYQKLAPTRAQADKFIDERMAAPFAADANDFLYQWDASRDYNAAPKLASIQASVLAINSADDERNPAELGLMERELQRFKTGRLMLIAASAETRGHGTTGMARFWQQALGEWLAAVPRRSPQP